MIRILWITGGVISVGLGMAGAVLPLLPTTPFILLAAYCFARSSPRMHDWLMTHRSFGPLIRNWQNHGAISLRAKRVAVGTVVATFLLSVGLGLAPWVLGVQGAVLGIVAIFILTRPNGPQD